MATSTRSPTELHLTKGQLVRLTLELGAQNCGGSLSAEEKVLCRQYQHTVLPPRLDIRTIAMSLSNGEDLLGENWGRITPTKRRATLGLVYTPTQYIPPMVQWVARFEPTRVVDIGCGSGRFALEAERQLPKASLIAIDIDPVATLVTRARLAVRGCKRARVIQADYLDLPLARVDGVTAFVGNPPYVRHQYLTQEQKTKARELAQGMGLSLSGYAGSHVHFLIATAAKTSPDDVGCFLINAEWMQANYGLVLRNLLIGQFGLEALHLLDPLATAFPDVMTTAAIIGFRVGSKKRTVEFTRHATPETLGHPNGQTTRLPRSSFKTSRWNFELNSCTQSTENSRPTYIPLSQICDVHRGIATGANSFFVMTVEQADVRGLTAWVKPVITGADEVFEAEGGVVRRSQTTRVLLCPPKDIDLNDVSLSSLREYLQAGEHSRFHRRYLCTHRKPWWYLGNPAPAPIVSTYMARRSPGFALNPDKMLSLNVVHGIYPRVSLSSDALEALVQHLNKRSKHSLNQGRVYQSGLWKFEPKDVEAISIRPVAQLLRLH
jgi:adenine-specific DNA-methyltransferase